MSVSSPKRSSAFARPSEWSLRKLATITGLLWIATFITSIPAVLLYDPLLNNENFILGAGGGDTRIFIGATLELLLIIANIGTAVVPFVLFKRYNERLAVGSSPPASWSAGSSPSASSACWRSRRCARTRVARRTTLSSPWASRSSPSMTRPSCSVPGSSSALATA